jgi:pimeloyl-ACP methyl ester carboxylesterase
MDRPEAMYRGVMVATQDNRAMADPPVTRFARNGDVHLAYQVFGGGAVDMLFVDDWVHHVEQVWEFPEFARFLRRLGAFARVIHFDRRGTGLSDPVPADALPSLETQVEDAVAVLDAAGSEQAAVLGMQVGSLIAMLLAASRPERCRAMVLYAAAAMALNAPDHPLGRSHGEVEEIIKSLSEDLAQGGEGAIAVLAPNHADDERFRLHVGRMNRAAVRPGTVGHFFRQSLLTDLRHVLPIIQAPTLVIHRTGDQVVPVELGREVAQLIPGANLRELPGTDHLAFAGDSDALVDEIEELLTGTRTGAEPERVLAALLFTDIVDSTRIAAELGDRRWRDVLDEHRALVRRELARSRGQELATTGDGFLASFDDPAEPCVVPYRSSARAPRWTSRFGQAYMPARSTCAALMSEG